MKSAVETLNPTRVKLTVEVPFDELKPSMDAAYRTIASQVVVPGFRKGKVPPRIIDQRFGRGAVLEEAVNEALPKFYLEAVERSEVRPLGQPQVDVTEVPDPASGGELKFTAEVDVRPTIVLPDLTNPQVQVDAATPDEDEVASRLLSLQERFGTLNPVDRPARTGDFISLDLAAELDGAEIDSVKGVSYEVGSGSMLPELDDVIPDMSAGETTTFSTALLGGEHVGQTALMTLTVQSVKERLLPELDDDFAQEASEFDTLDELRDSLQVQAEQFSRYRQGIQARDRLLESLLADTEIPVPDGLIAEEVRRHLENEGKEPDDEHGIEVEAQARREFRGQLLLDAIVEAEKVSISQQELVEFMIISAAEMQIDPNEFAKSVGDAGQIPSMVSEVARRKALSGLLLRSTVTDPSGATLDLNDLFATSEPASESAVEEAGQLPDASAAAQPARPAAVADGPSATDPTALPSLGLPSS